MPSHGLLSPGRDHPRLIDGWWRCGCLWCRGIVRPTVWAVGRLLARTCWAAIRTMSPLPTNPRHEGNLVAVRVWWIGPGREAGTSSATVVAGCNRRRSCCLRRRHRCSRRGELVLRSYFAWRSKLFALSPSAPSMASRQIRPGMELPWTSSWYLPPMVTLSIGCRSHRVGHLTRRQPRDRGEASEPNGRVGVSRTGLACGIATQRHVSYRFANRSRRSRP